MLPRVGVSIVSGHSEPSLSLFHPLPHHVVPLHQHVSPEQGSAHHAVNKMLKTIEVFKDRNTKSLSCAGLVGTPCLRVVPLQHGVPPEQGPAQDFTRKI